MNKQLHGLLSRALKTALAWLLLIVAWTFPVAGWHRLYLKLPGWYLWPMAGYFGIASAMLFLITHQHFWLAGFSPQVVLLICDCILIVDRVWRTAK